MRNAYVSFDLDPLDLHALGVSGFHLGCVEWLFGPPWSMFFVGDFICMSGGYVGSSGRFTLLSVMCAGSLDGLVQFVDPSSSFGWSYDALGVLYWLS
ncbi:hypothetical protein OG21DRAFT_1502437 [Imleria badia]|nr:hypothetical protein OG21DRAFT_1502437 [Imleria badia]